MYGVRSLDLGSPEGKSVLSRLLETADVVVENFRPDVMERLGFGFAALQELNPRLICCSINGVGAEGPYADRRIYDAVVQAISGMATLQSDGHQPTFMFPTPPQMVNTLAADKLTAVTAAQNICSALCLLWTIDTKPTNPPLFLGLFL